jgi:hypothetical protein
MKLVHRFHIVIFCAALMFVALPRPSMASPANPIITNMVSQVSQTNVSDNIWSICYPETNRLDYIQNTLLSYGMDVNLQPLPTYGTNIIATIPGTKTPEKVYIIGAHWDVFFGPGADDNTSGVSGVLEVARIMSQYSFESTVKLIAFDREESGLGGSRYYVEDAIAREEDISGVLIHEMIGYTAPWQNPVPGHNLPLIGNFIAVGANTASQWLGLSYVDAIDTYVPQLPYYYGVDENFSLSDHWPFWQNGFDAVPVTDTNGYRNFNYHQLTDTPDTLDMVFTTNVTRASLATMASLAVPIPEPASLFLLGSGLIGLIGFMRKKK